MNQQAVTYCAEQIREMIDPHRQIDARQEVSGDTVHHFLWMCDQITSGAVEGRKSHRWLGYLQCAMVFSGQWDLDDMKNLSRSAIERFPDDVPTVADVIEAVQALPPNRRKVIGSAIRDTPDIVRMSDNEERVYRLLGKLILEERI
jgi:hypothetical protein